MRSSRTYQRYAHFKARLLCVLTLNDTDLLSRLHCTFCLLYLLYSGMTAWEHI